jgi:hypothetical protein
MVSSVSFVCWLIVLRAVKIGELEERFDTRDDAKFWFVSRLLLSCFRTASKSVSAKGWVNGGRALTSFLIGRKYDDLGSSRSSRRGELEGEDYWWQMFDYAWRL